MDAVSSSVAVAAPPRLPRIRASRLSSAPADERPGDTSSQYQDTVGSSVATGGVVDDIVSPLSPTASEQRRENEQQRPGAAGQTPTPDNTSRPLSRMLSRLDVAEQCRWSGLLLIVYYGITVLLWPSLFVSAMGLLCGLSGALACFEPYTIHKIVWVFAFAYLNVAMLGALAWTALHQFVFREASNDSDATSINDLYSGAFLLLGLVVHLRSFQAAQAVIANCKLAPTLFEAVIPENWRRQEPPADAEASLGNQHVEFAVRERRSRASSSVHSFEIDIQSRPHSPVSPAASLAPSTPRSEPTSPVTTPFHRLDDAPL